MSLPSLLKLHLRHDEVLRVRETVCLWTDKHKIANLLWVSKCNTQGEIATVRTSDHCSLRWDVLTEKRSPWLVKRHYFDAIQILKDATRASVWHRQAYVQGRRKAIDV